MLLRSLSATALGTALLLQIATPSGAATLINENFNSVAPALAVTSGVPSFTVTSNDVDLLGSNLFDFYPGNGTYIDLSGNNAGAITSTDSFSFNPGDVVTLSFSYGANGNGRSANVSLGSIFSDVVSTSQDTSASPAFLTFNQTFTVQSGTTASLVFTSLSPGNGGILLDNVSLTTSPAPVPEPVMLPALLTLGVFGGALVLRRKQVSEQA